MLGRLAAWESAGWSGPAWPAGALALVLLQLRVAPATVVAAACYGAAFGVVQTGAFVGILRGAGHGRSAGVSGFGTWRSTPASAAALAG